MLKAIGLYDLWLLLLISFNLEHGPRNEEQRRHDLRSRLQSVYSGRTPRNTPLFLSMVNTMAKDIEQYMGHSFDGDGPLEDQVWEFCKNRILFN